MYLLVGGWVGELEIFTYFDSPFWIWNWECKQINDVYLWYYLYHIIFEYLKQVMVRTTEIHMAFNNHEELKVLCSWDG